jgi:hypothetical protein
MYKPMKYFRLALIQRSLRSVKVGGGDSCEMLERFLGFEVICEQQDTWICGWLEPVEGKRFK